MASCIILVNDIKMKRCSVCKELKSIIYFSVRSSVTGNLESMCKLCRSNYYKTLYYEKGGKESKDAYYIQHRDELLPKLRLRGGHNPYNPDKQLARIAVSRALKKGTLIRPDKCSKCNKQCQPTAHHWHGYDKVHRLDVQWLCEGCHNLVDNPDFADRLSKSKRVEV